MTTFLININLTPDTPQDHFLRILNFLPIHYLKKCSDLAESSELTGVFSYVCSELKVETHAHTHVHTHTQLVHNTAHTQYTHTPDSLIFLVTILLLGLYDFTTPS